MVTHRWRGFGSRAVVDKRMTWSFDASFGLGPRHLRRRQKKEKDGIEVVFGRKNPMVYEPKKLCHCNPQRKAPRWISWST
jgi:hypothetical protein